MFKVHVGLFAVAIINALYNIIAESIGKSGLNPIIFSVYRDACAAPILYGCALGLNSGQIWPEKQDLIRFVLQGFLGIYLNQILFLLGVQLTNSTIGSICNLTLPVFAATLGIWFGKESFKWSTAIGLIFCILGALIMKTGNSKDSMEQYSLLGVGILLLGAFCSALYYIIQKKMLQKYSAVFVTSWEYVFALGFMFLSALFFTDMTAENWRMTSTGMIALIFTVLFNSGNRFLLWCYHASELTYHAVAKYWLNSICNKYVSATVLTAWSTLVPVLTAIFALLAFGTSFQSSYLGSIPVIIGICFVTLAKQTQASTSTDGIGLGMDDSYAAVSAYET